MLALILRSGEVVFVFHRGHPIGVLAVRDKRANGRNLRVPLLFSGRRDDFEVLRPKMVERRYGRRQLDKLTRQFLGQQVSEPGNPLTSPAATAPSIPRRAPRSRSSHRIPGT